MESEREVFESDREAFETFLSKSLRVFSAVGVFEPIATAFPKSKVPPDVFGGFAEPNEANAPDPKPNALDAPTVGEMSEAEGDIALKGFLLPWDELSPCLLPSV